MNREQIRKFFKSWVTWFAIIISILAPFGQLNPSLWFLAVPFTGTILALMPAGLATMCSPGLTERFAKFHKRRNQDKGSYYYSTVGIKIPSVLKFSLRTTLYAFAIMCNVLSLTGMFETLSENINKTIVSLMMLSIPSLFIASIINVAIYLLTKSGLMFENKEDNSRINLGKELLSRFDWAISPIAFTSLIYPLVTKFHLMTFVLITMMVVFIFCFYAAFMSYYLLKKFQMNRLTTSVQRRLDRICKILGSD